MKNTPKMLADEFTKRVRDLEQTSLELREALMKRKSEVIWEVLERQEQCVMHLDELRRESALWEAAPPGASNHLSSEQTEIIKTSMAKTRLIQRINRNLSRVFLDLIEKTFNSLRADLPNSTPTYGARGIIERMTGPMFVQQTG